MAQGIMQGRNETQLAIARKALNRNMPLEDITALTGLPWKKSERFTNPTKKHT